ncbi:YheC/YheD family protein [Metabacillus halosaccharovorans]|uniref:YheC/YheD family protein n=1 Tax=Metabacillus halosaccharovorans TaxID=930124 RepID=A0ABT3DL87_9BACI|nr:YheC/YheD family protein [Metabacillus halosaccharovorans]MCV9887818.1 YheC/YheD family protein [Metabacillus halosaccharovorans]
MYKPRINNKFHKHQIMMEDPCLAEFIPETRLFTNNNLIDLLNKYKKVIVKPSRGSLGKGIVVITELGTEEYELLQLNKQKHINGLENVYKYLKKLENFNIPNIVQYYIPLAKVYDRPMDLRYIAQRTEQDWTITGKYARVAKVGYALTNFEHGSSILTVEDALKSSTIKNFNIKELNEKLNMVTLSITTCLSRYFPNHKIWGCDLCVDEKGSIWIIEVNSSPQIKGFLELESLLPMYQSIVGYKTLNKKKGRRSR